MSYGLYSKFAPSSLSTLLIPPRLRPRLIPPPSHLPPPFLSQVSRKNSNSFFAVGGAGTTVTWTSAAIPIVCLSNITLTAALGVGNAQDGGLTTDDDVLRWFYSLDSGPAQLALTVLGAGELRGLAEKTIATLPVSAKNASSLVLSAQTRTAASSSGRYRVDDVTVRGVQRPPVDASWSPWAAASSWGAWAAWTPADCGMSQVQTRNRTRTRTCRAATCGGQASCAGDTHEVQMDERQRGAEDNCCGPPVDGRWSEWEAASETEWSAWSPADCGVPQARTQSLRFERTCTPPECGGAACVGPATFTSTSSQSRTAAENCCAQPGSWGDWMASAWTPWTAFEPAGCGVNQTRLRARVNTRACDSPPARCGGADCPGDASVLQRDVHVRGPEGNCCVTDGAWSAWVPSVWTAWSGYLPPECGTLQTRQRLREKSRSCSEPAPSCGGKDCAGTDLGTDSQTETRTAAENCCTLDGGWGRWVLGAWGPWASWAPASLCGVAQTRERFRTNTRSCSSPPPSCGGKECVGDAKEAERETATRTGEENCCVVDGGLTPWTAGPWSPWSPFAPAVCGVAQERQRARVLSRNCTAPAPACGGMPCLGDTLLVATENATRSAEVNCCPVDGSFSAYAWSGNWSAWTAWEPAAACGQEQTRLRFRQQARECNAPAPSCGGAVCSGRTVNLAEERESRVINATRDGEWSLYEPGSAWSAWTAFAPQDACSGEQSRSRRRSVTRTCIPAQCGGADCVGLADTVEVQWDNRTVDGAVDSTWAAWRPVGEWAPWSPWSPEECGVAQGRQRARLESRSCVPGACGGAPCPAQSDSRLRVDNATRDAAATCSGNCTRDGAYGVWQLAPWSLWTPLNSTLCGEAQVRWERMEQSVLKAAS